MLEGGRALHRSAVRAGDHHAQSGAAGDDGRGGNAYRDRIIAAAGPGFTPLMTCYLTDAGGPRTRSRAGFEAGRVDRRQALSGRRDHQQRQRRHRHRAIIRPRWSGCRRIGMVLCVHGEVTDPEVDVFDREAVFIDRVLNGAGARFPRAQDRLRAYHHRRGGGFRRRGAARISPRRSRRSTSSSTATPCSPGGFGPTLIACRSPSASEHRLAVRKAATSGSPKYFLGTDSAPHAREAKE